MALCIETKLTLSGGTETYPCELVRHERGFGILRYVIDRDHDIKGVRLRPGDVTCALYWEDRPYTLYVWRLKHDGSTAYYFNIADSLSLTPGEFRWRDLAVDILVDGQGMLHVLDEDEVPPGLDTGLAAYIQMAKEHILSNFLEIIAEANVLLRARKGC